ncbi:unnamed protein product, partial [Ectocarpus fasciculatus]
VSQQTTGARAFLSTSTGRPWQDHRDPQLLYLRTHHHHWKPKAHLRACFVRWI